MSDDLTRRIEELVWQIIAGMDEPEAAIASLIAEERADLVGKLGEAHGRILRLQENYAAQKAARASARREALEEVIALAGRVGFVSVEDIRSLAAKEADNGQ